MKKKWYAKGKIPSHLKIMSNNKKYYTRENEQDRGIRLYTPGRTLHSEIGEPALGEGGAL